MLTKCSGSCSGKFKWPWRMLGNNSDLKGEKKVYMVKNTCSFTFEVMGYGCCTTIIVLLYWWYLQIDLFLFHDFYYFFLIFKLYIIVLVLPNINMNPPQVYMCSPSWTLLPPPSPFHPSGSSQCPSPKHTVSCIEPGLFTLSWGIQAWNSSRA